uniref:DUF1758 domain-containing protein n=1 Tax=Haemonchus contortus TaxID=6289 RepID=A0A7I5EB81_HAECO
MNCSRLPDGWKLEQVRSRIKMGNFSKDLAANDTKSGNDEEGEPNLKSSLCCIAIGPTTVHAKGDKQRNNNEEVLLMCTEVTLVNPDDNSETAKTMAFLDSRSTHSYITTEVAEKTELSQFKEKDITLHTFGNKEAQTVSSSSTRSTSHYQTFPYTLRKYKPFFSSQIPYLRPTNSSL